MNSALSSVQQTMLWTLHNRAREARRPEGLLRDSDCVRIFDAQTVHFDGTFGPAGPFHGVRSRLFDEEVREFVRRNPDAVIVNLGEGLEMQRYRLADLPARWLTVDLPDALRVREHFIQPDAAYLHVAASALDRGWMDAVPPGPAHITAPGLLMFLEPSLIGSLLRDVAARFPGAWLSFDTIPPWLSRKATRGDWRLTPAYPASPMPWGVTPSGLRRLVAAASPGARVRELRSRFPRGVGRWLFPTMQRTPVPGDHTPAAWTVELP